MFDKIIGLTHNIECYVNIFLINILIFNYNNPSTNLFFLTNI